MSTSGTPQEDDADIEESLHQLTEESRQLRYLFDLVLRRMTEIGREIEMLQDQENEEP